LVNEVRFYILIHFKHWSRYTWNSLYTNYTVTLPILETTGARATDKPDFAIVVAFARTDAPREPL